MQLNDVFTDYVNNGIFTFLNNLDVPWKSLNIFKQLNLIYHGNHSGKKEVSPMLDSLILEESLTENDKTLIAMSIFSIFSVKWKKLYATLSLEYKPLENYDMQETEKTTGNIENTDSVNGTINTSVNNEQNSSSNKTSSLYGFNSVTDVNSDKDNVTDDSTITETGETKEVREKTNMNNSTEDRTLTRHGNIGVTTSQQMLQSEIQLWQWTFFNDVFKDIDTILTIQTY